MTDTDPKHHPEIYATVEALCETQKIEAADVARAVGMQPGTFKRSATGNPTVKFLKRIGWALGCHWMWLALETEKVADWVRSGAIRFDREAPAFRAHQVAHENRSSKKSKAKRKYNVDVTDKEVLAKQYPPQAVKGEVLDTNYVEFEPPLPPRHINEDLWERRREQLGVGLEDHLVMTDHAVEAGFSYEEYIKQQWTLEMLAEHGLVCNKGQE